MIGMALGAPGGRARAAFRAGRVSSYSTSAFWKSSVVVMPMLNASCCRVATPCTVSAAVRCADFLKQVLFSKGSVPKP